MSILPKIPNSSFKASSKSTLEIWAEIAEDTKLIENLFTDLYG